VTVLAAASKSRPGQSEQPARGVDPARRRRFALLLGLPVVWWILVLGVPYILMIVISFWPVTFLNMRPGFTLTNWETVFTVPLYWQALLRSIKVGLIVTVIALVIGYPVAYFIATRVKRRPTLYYVLFQIPLWVSYLIRAYAWRVILGDNGVINQALMATGITSQPVKWLLFTQFSVVLVITTMFIPFMVMSIYPSLAAIPPSLREAAKDLHAGRFRTLLKVTLPLSLPGVIVGCTYSLAISFGDFIAPTLVGGPRSTMMTQLIFNNIGVAYDWPLAAALGLTMFIVILPLVMASSRFEGNERLLMGR
jgi:spermidine/putrescine transport system permease protein